MNSPSLPHSITQRIHNRVTLSGTWFLLLLTFTHMTNDIFTSMLSAALPTLQGKFNLTESHLAWLVAVLSLSGSMLQPLFGSVADRLGRRNTAALGVLTSSFLLSLMGVVPSFWLLMGLLFIGGLGSAAFHPAATAMARRSLGVGRRSGLAVAIFGFGGTCGLALGPIIIVAIIAHFGIGYSPLLMIPGLLMAGLVWWLIPSQKGDIIKRAGFLDFSLLAGPIGWLAFAGILRGIAFVTFQNATPLWLVAQGFADDDAIIGWTLGAYGFSAGIGGIIGGYLNRYIRRGIIIPMAMLTSLPVMLLLLSRYSSANPAGGWDYFALVILSGLLINSCVPLMIITAQDLAPEAIGTASGLLMGFTWGTAGVLYIGIGKIQEVFGLVPSMYLAYLTLIPAAIVAWWLLAKYPETR